MIDSRFSPRTTMVSLSDSPNLTIASPSVTVATGRQSNAMLSKHPIPRVPCPRDQYNCYRLVTVTWTGTANGPN
jgi:hypothetical protein